LLLVTVQEAIPPSVESEDLPKFRNVSGSTAAPGDS
jgi:hypothetical protein